jgi:hypothetical protein
MSIYDLVGGRARAGASDNANQNKRAEKTTSDTNAAKASAETDAATDSTTGGSTYNSFSPLSESPGRSESCNSCCKYKFFHSRSP